MSSDLTSICQLHLEYAVLSEKIDPRDFDCGDKDLNDFIKDGTALKYQSQHLAYTTCVFHNKILVGYYSIAADALQLITEECDDIKEGVAIRNFPALKLARMAVHKDHHKNKIGRLLVEIVKGKVVDLNKQGTAIRLLTVDAYPARVEFYTKCGFVLNKNQPKKRTVSMRCDVYK